MQTQSRQVNSWLGCLITVRSSSSPCNKDNRDLNLKLCDSMPLVVFDSQCITHSVSLLSPYFSPPNLMREKKKMNYMVEMKPDRRVGRCILSALFIKSYTSSVPAGIKHR